MLPNARLHSTTDIITIANPPLMHGVLTSVTCSEFFDMPSGDLSEELELRQRRKLLGDARDGSLSAFGELLEIYRPYLQMVADFELSSEVRQKVSASDLVQDSFLEAQRDFRSFRGETEAEFRAWLRQVLVHNIQNTVRTYRDTEKRNVRREEQGCRIAEHEQSTDVTRASCPISVVIHHEDQERLHLAIQSLPDHYRQVLFLRSYERLPFEEIGIRTHRTAEASRKIWVRAIEQLQQELGALNKSSRG
ncbi:MAG: sigma-70 family RNA polymerase sigma factor [Planctomycetaceae bacterium]